MQKINILIVEDEAIVAEDIKNTLQKKGYFVIATVFSGKDALKTLEEEYSSGVKDNITNLVLMDIVLHNSMSGIEAADIIRFRYRIPVVYLTAYADSKTVEQAKKTEPFGYIVKPYNDKDLFIAIEMALYKHDIENKIKESHEWLSAVLNSIGDAVITTDINGLITFMNPTSEALTGWSHEDAMGQYFEKVFNIFDEKTNVKIDPPILKILKNGNKFDCNLESSVFLKSVNEEVFSVYVSCSPIKDAKGIINGAVLILKDITEKYKNEKKIREMNEKLTDLNDELKTLDVIKNNFLSNISHELKTPLVAVKGYTELIVGGRSGQISDIVKNQLSISLKSIDKLILLIERLLCFSKMELHLEKLCVDSFNILDVVKDAINNVKVKAVNGEVTIIQDIKFNELRVKADKDKLFQVFTNLLDNAVKFTPNGGKVTVKIEKNNDKLVCSVIDTGIGISAKHIDKIFDRFYQVDSSSTRKYSGVGIGLSICKDIILLHNGKITVECKEGQGCTFTFIIPLKQ